MPATCQNIGEGCWFVRYGDEHKVYGDPYTTSVLIRTEEGATELVGLVGHAAPDLKAELFRILRDLDIDKVFFMRRVEWII